MGVIEATNVGYKYLYLQNLVHIFDAPIFLNVLQPKGHNKSRERRASNLVVRPISWIVCLC